MAKLNKKRPARSCNQPEAFIGEQNIGVLPSSISISYKGNHTPTISTRWNKTELTPALKSLLLRLFSPPDANKGGEDGSDKR